MPRIIDISLTITSDMLLWPTHSPPEFRQIESIVRGDNFNLTHCSLVVHTGTHVDAPYHCYSNGKGVEEVPLSALVGKAFVADFTRVSEFISVKDLQEIKEIDAIEILLCKTKNSQFRLMQKEFDKSYVYVSAEAAKYLKKTSVRTLGVDYLSVERYGAIECPTHRILLNNGIVIIEGLNLRTVEPGFYRFYCLPLKFKGLDGAPARAVLIEETID